MNRLTFLVAGSLFLFVGCGILPLRRSHLTVEKVLERSSHWEVSDSEGFREARYSIGSIRDELKRVCLLWPLESNRVNSRFGRRWGRAHQGVDLRARTGTRILAALPGRVIYAGDDVGGYGNLVILKHARGLSTVYAHASELRVLEGQLVGQGDLIAFSGKSGRATGPHLHFEIRDGGEPINPTQLLLGSLREPAEASKLCFPPLVDETIPQAASSSDASSTD